MQTVFLGIAAASEKWFLAENRQVLSLQRTVLGAVANVVLNLWLIPLHGAVGAALATVISYGIAAFISDVTQKEAHKMFFMKLSALNPFAIYQRYI